MKTRKVRELLKETDKAYMVRLVDEKAYWIAKSVCILERPYTQQTRLVMQDWAKLNLVRGPQ